MKHVKTALQQHLNIVVLLVVLFLLMFTLLFLRSSRAMLNSLSNMLKAHYDIIKLILNLKCTILHRVSNVTSMIPTFLTKTVEGSRG